MTYGFVFNIIIVFNWSHFWFCSWDHYCFNNREY